MPALRQRVKLEYELDGTEHEVITEYTAIDVRAWEAEFNKSALIEKTSFSMLTWMGHHAAVRKGELNGEMKAYQAFDAVCTNVEGVPDDEGPTKTGTATRGRGTPKDPGAKSSAA